MPPLLKTDISGVRPATDPEWDEIWQGCEYATYFHSREWAMLWAYYTKGGLRPEPRIVTFSDGNRALLPFSFHLTVHGEGPGRRRSPLISGPLDGYEKTYVSSPAGTYGGWLSDGPLTEAHAGLLLGHIKDNFGRLTMRLNPFSCLSMGAGFEAEYDETHAIKLSEGFEAIIGRWTKGHRSAVGKARREGVAVRVAEGLDDWQSYFSIYRSSINRWGWRASSSYGWGLFSEMYKLSSSNIKLWLAFKDGKAIAGAIMFYTKRHVAYWHGAALDEFFPLRPVNLMISDAILDACKGGYSWFDFNPSGGHEGVKAFKRSFGAKALPCPVIIKEPGRK